MNNYSFDTLNDKEFENLCADLLGKKFGKTFERFKPGKDKGIDGRYLRDDGNAEIIQCKHWIRTSLDNLIKSLEKTEKEKVDKLNPERYFFCTSKEFGTDSKAKIQAALGGHIKTPKDIFGREDLNQLLNEHPGIEKRHFKLWLQSTVVLNHILKSGIYGRSEYAMKELQTQSAKYAVTENHEKARAKLEKEGVLVISGDPGIGKTTLAENLALEYVGNGFEYIVIADDLKEAESVFDKNERQLFYFDDFLGRII
ncbi:restriction endonuclease [Herbaspirillum huttiense SE1]|uniref:Restriction endonuclease n=1 Tax=Herbaspirillum huttiense subsp. lycopersici TaxID=3074428 RepID=A0ABU2EGN8_9BURK|nr:restriction endonuclease [Herbaspirillum huttiense]MDR9847296.1 restriction endonuclease [Herbaspirillum huttiense SE1]